MIIPNDLDFQVIARVLFVSAKLRDYEKSKHYFKKAHLLSKDLGKIIRLSSLSITALVNDYRCAVPRRLYKSRSPNLANVVHIYCMSKIVIDVQCLGVDVFYTKFKSHFLCAKNKGPSSNRIKCKM